MMRSMFSGVSGLRAHQMKMDTIGNNIANVNTVGFKGQRVTFQEVFNQTIKGAGSPQAGKGGTNPQQVGLGISISTIDTFHTRGAVQRTDNNTDLAINGDGFFILSDQSDFGRSYYTRAGNFSLDQAGNLVASNGFNVGGQVYNRVTGEYEKELTGIKISKTDSIDASATGNITIEGNLNSSDPIGDKYVTNCTVYDELGNDYKLQYEFNKTADNKWDLSIKHIYNTTPPTEMYISNTGAEQAGAAVFTSLTFASGKLDTTVVPPVPTWPLPQITLTGENGGIGMPITADVTALTQFANETTTSVHRGDKDGNGSGNKMGFLDTFSIGPTGEVFGIYTNGESQKIAKIRVATFKNPAGLEKTSENMFQMTNNSGEPNVTDPGQGGSGSLNPGTLEMSNVDISREFTEMITTQRGFQANSRIITTSDEMLQELVNMKR